MDLQNLYEVAADHVPEEVVDALRIGRMTALQKDDGGVRGIVVGDVFRRVFARTIAIRVQGEAATGPFLFALSKRAGCECATHLIRSATYMDDRTTIVSVDGTGACDSVSRNCMLAGLHGMVDGDQMIPFVRLFCGSPSVFLWEDDVGDSHEIVQGEGGEQGDPLMPLLFSLGQHSAMLGINAGLAEGESLFAFLDDLYVLCSPERVKEVHSLIKQQLWSVANIQVHQSKTKVWNRAGVEPAGCHELTLAARLVKKDAAVWTGDPNLPSVMQGMRVLGSPIGHPDFARSVLGAENGRAFSLLDHIPSIPDLQSAWLVLVWWTTARANFWLRTVPPEWAHAFAEAHDRGLSQCLCAIMHVSVNAAWSSARESATLPLSMGGLGLRSAKIKARPAIYQGQVGRPFWLSLSSSSSSSRKCSQAPH